MDKKHLMRLFVVNGATIEQMHINVRHKNYSARYYFVRGQTDARKFWLKEVAKDKAALARLVETQKAIKKELRTGKRSTKKHGMESPLFRDWLYQNDPVAWLESETGRAIR